VHVRNDTSTNYGDLEMKKFYFGALLTFIGLVFAAICFIFALLNPWDYNGITGLLGSLLGTQTLLPFLISLMVLLMGLYICGKESFRNK
jgi:uncharacterized BrkB/YihY/UPF0761 family membrane protein